MSQRKQRLRGVLNGRPLLGSIDKEGVRENKKQAIKVIRKEDEFVIGYEAYIFEEEPGVRESYLKQEGITYITNVIECEELLDYDIVSIDEKGIIRIQYRIDSNDNIIFITNNCNSNCIMCPEAEILRRKTQTVDIEEIRTFIGLIPEDTQYLTITGGEPTLIKEELFTLLQECRERLLHTQFQLLTNGRSFAIKSFADKFLDNMPCYMKVAIPLYSHDETTHDKITKVSGSWKQTKKGISNIGQRVEVEIRVVIMQENYKGLDLLAEMIINEMPYVSTVSFMGLELLGNAAICKEEIWVEYEEMMPYLEKAILRLINKGIQASIYNYPLCAIPERLWSITRKSISDYKVRYKEACEECIVKLECGGFFFSTINYSRAKAKPIGRKRKNGI